MAALFCVKWRHGRHLESVTSNRKSDSVSRCLFTWRTILPNFIPIRFETTALQAFLKSVAAARTTRLVATCDQLKHVFTAIVFAKCDNMAFNHFLTSEKQRGKEYGWRQNRSACIRVNWFRAGSIRISWPSRHWRKCQSRRDRQMRPTVAPLSRQRHWHLHHTREN